MDIFKIDDKKYVAKALCFHSLTTAIDVLKKLYDCKDFNVVNMEERAKAYWLNNWKPKPATLQDRPKPSNGNRC